MAYLRPAYGQSPQTSLRKGIVLLRPTGWPSRKGFREARFLPACQDSTPGFVRSLDAEGVSASFTIGPALVYHCTRPHPGGRPPPRPTETLEECERCQAEILKCGRYSKLIATGS